MSEYKTMTSNCIGTLRKDGKITLYHEHSMNINTKQIETCDVHGCDGRSSFNTCSHI